MTKKNGKSPVVRIARPKGRPIQIWYRNERGKKIRISTGSYDESEAENQRATLEAQLTLGMTRSRKSNNSKEMVGPQMSWEHFRHLYTQHRLARSRTKTSIDAESRLDISERIIKPKTLADMCHRESLNDLQNRLLRGDESRFGRPRSTSTVRGYMRAVIAALNWAVKQGWHDRLPDISIIKVEADEDMKGRPLCGEEVDRFNLAVEHIVGSEARDSWNYLVNGVIASGLRLDELMNISWDIPQTIQPQWQRGRLPVLWFPGYRQKNGKTQEIPLCPWFEEVLLQTPEERRTGWVFNPESLQSKYGRTYTGDRLCTDRVGKVLSKIGQRANIIVDEGNPRTGATEKYASCHDLRRTFAQNLADSELPPELVRRLMRHADLRTTERYYQVVNTQKDAGKIRAILAPKENDSAIQVTHSGHMSDCESS